MVAGQHDEEFRARRLQDVEVLEHRVGGAAIPGRLVEPLLRRQQIEELVHLRAQKRPAHLQMPQQAVRLVLGQDGDAADVRVDAVRQDEIDDAELAAEEHRRLGAPVGQLLEPAAASAGEDQRDRPAREAFLNAGRRKHAFLLLSLPVAIPRAKYRPGPSMLTLRRRHRAGCARVYRECRQEKPLPRRAAPATASGAAVLPRPDRARTAPDRPAASRLRCRCRTGDRRSASRLPARSGFPAARVTDPSTGSV